MQERTALDRLEEEMENALASLTPAPTGVSADALWYRAALSRERRRANRWRGAAAIALFAAGAALLWRPKPLMVDRVVVVHEQHKSVAPPAPFVATTIQNREPGGDELAAAAYLQLRDALVENGPQSLRPTAAGEGDAATGWSARSTPAQDFKFEFGTNLKDTFIRGG